MCELINYQTIKLHKQVYNSHDSYSHLEVWDGKHATYTRKNHHVDACKLFQSGVNNVVLHPVNSIVNNVVEPC